MEGGPERAEVGGHVGEVNEVWCGEVGEEQGDQLYRQRKQVYTAFICRGLGGVVVACRGVGPQIWGYSTHDSQLGKATIRMSERDVITC